MEIIEAGVGHVALIAPLFDAYRQFYKRPSDLAGAERYLRERLARKECVIFLAMNDDEAIGFTQLYPSWASLSMKPLWILYDLFVTPKARRTGAAKALMERARQLAVSTGAEGLLLETATDNHPAQRLYESLGWKRDTEFYTYLLKLS
jgi:GNAT superfamily N-acetyltransferase